MNILSLQLGKMASACLVQEYYVVAAASQERFDNIKGSDAFPIDVINWLLAYGDMELADLDLVTVSGEDQLITADQLAVPPEKIIYVPHHLCHAYAPLAYWGGAPDPCLVFVADGRSTDVHIWKNDELNILSHSLESLGAFYAMVTEFLGMKSYAHEGKTMGLASYAKKEDFEPVYIDLFGDLVVLDEANPLKIHVHISDIEKRLRSSVGKVRFDHLAGAAQYCLEQIVTAWVRAAIHQTGANNIMTSGGVFTNVKLNKIIREMPEVTNFWCMPSCGNETNVFGAAGAVCPDMWLIQNIYLGQSYSDEEIEHFLAQHKTEFSFTHHDDIEDVVSSLLADKKIVARFAGDAEFGARSLGNRAILAHPADRESFYEINDQIKARDFWMPFAPTILDVDAMRYLKNISEPPFSAYMMDSFDTTSEGQRDLCAAMHQSDKTVRPQIIQQLYKSDYYRLIELFKEKTGIGAVMNTSFNLHGFPLAATLDQAIFTMKNSDLQYLALGSWLVVRY